MIKTRILTALLVTLLATTALADPPVRDHDIVPEDYFTIGVITDCAVSPDGRLVAYTESRWDKDLDGKNTDLWIVDQETKAAQRLTFDKANEGSPRWSPDGRYLYFTSSRKRAGEEAPPYDGKKQVWRISPDGSGLLAVTRVADGIGLFDLSKNGTTLYYTATDEVVDEEWKDLREKYADLEYGHGVTDFSQVWKLDLDSWRAQKLVDEKRVIGAFAVSPDESRIAMITTPDEETITNEGWSRVDIYNAQTKEVSVVTEDGWRSGHPSPYGWIEGPRWSADGGALAFTVTFDGFPSKLYAAEWSGQTPSLHELTRPVGVEIVGGTAEWRGESRDLCVIGEDRARKRLYCLSDVRGGQQGKGSSLTQGDVTVSSYSFSPSGDRLAVVTGGLDHAGDLFLVSTAGSYERLTTVNPQIDTWKLPQISIVQWKGADGDDVEGILELPFDHKPGKPLPMVVEIHGGPTAATHYRFRLWIYGRALMAAKGYALLSVNYHGSTGYGDKFMTDLIGRENEIEVEDILTGVDAMIERGIADPDRLAVMGWSNGGYLTNCLITKTDRFKVASSGAGVLDMVIQWGTEDTPGHVVNFMKGLPWSNPETYKSASPIYDLHKVTTPTLIHVGQHDARVPPAHSRALYRALKHYLDVPTELIIYPGEGHGLTKYKHRMAKMEWDLAWFEKYLGPATAAPTQNPQPDEATN